jgi:hypothetical protein
MKIWEKDIRHPINNLLGQLMEEKDNPVKSEKSGYRILYIC